MRTFSLALLSLALLSLAACATAAPSTHPSTGPVAAARVEEGHALPFLEDDLPKALQQARERKVPLFVDAWASW
ncbi:MAG TPA: hypothetical protein VGK67_00880 [Myxococcales bacterium]|jgi:endonuclease YncB( thermonuclease family)